MRLESFKHDPCLEGFLCLLSWWDVDLTSCSLDVPLFWMTHVAILIT